MPALKVLELPDPALQDECKVVGLIGREEKKALNDMLETMYLNQGIGLAAPQVGILKRMIVLDVGGGPIQIVNPIITGRDGSERGQEGCLSLPGIMVDIKRATRIAYKGLNKDGKPVEASAEGLLARAIQHECDHLDGRLIIDYVNPIKRFFLKRRLRKKR